MRIGTERNQRAQPSQDDPTLEPLSLIAAMIALAASYWMVGLCDELAGNRSELPERWISDAARTVGVTVIALLFAIASLFRIVWSGFERGGAVLSAWVAAWATLWAPIFFEFFMGRVYSELNFTERIFGYPGLVSPALVYLLVSGGTLILGLRILAVHTPCPRHWVRRVAVIALLLYALHCALILNAFDEIGRNCALGDYSKGMASSRSARLIPRPHSADLRVGYPEFSAWTGYESLEEWMAERPADSVLDRIGPLFDAPPDADLEEVIADYKVLDRGFDRVRLLLRHPTEELVHLPGILMWSLRGSFAEIVLHLTDDASGEIGIDVDIQDGDVTLDVNGERVTGLSELTAAVGRLPDGDQRVVLRVEGNGKYQQFIDVLDAIRHARAVELHLCLE